MLAGVLLLPLLAALALLGVPNGARRTAAIVAAAGALLAAGLLVPVGIEVFAGNVVRIAWPWLALPGADFGLRADGLAFAFAALVLGIGALVILYAAYYLGPDEPVARFYALFMLFMTSMLGVVLADNLLLLVVFWELTSVASFLLIGFRHHDPGARRAARLAIAITGAGGLALLAGVVLIAQVVGSFSLDAVLASGDLLRSHPLYGPALLLVLAGAFTKSAQFPFHFWLPEAMAAPTPVSAYLHSATLVKAGIFLVARLHPVLSGTDLWFWTVGGAGLATLLAGAWIAVFRHDIKGLLAYSTVSHLGLITLLFGLGSPLATVAAVFHVMNHATFKASLFMAAGIIDHEAGTRDMRRINGLWRYMPHTGALAIASSLAMAGVPLLNGFLSKEMFFAESVALGGGTGFAVVVPAVATLAGAFSVAYSMRFIHDVFFNGEPVGLDRTPHEPPRWMKVPVEILTALCLLVGVLPAVTVGPLLDVAARPVVGGPLPAYSLALWHGFNLPLLMSALAMALGVAFYFSLQRLFGLHDRISQRPTGGAVARALGRPVLAIGRDVAAATQQAGVTRTLVALGATALLLGAWPWIVELVRSGPGTSLVPRLPALQGVDVLTIVVWTIGVVATIAAAAVAGRRPLHALLLAGTAGLVVSLAFAASSAPDLALTQLLVEVVSVVLLMLALPLLRPSGAAAQGPGARATGRLLLAAGSGVGTTLLTLAVLGRQPEAIGEWFLANAVGAAAGHNAVNVIIVDFRGFDTLGEVTVLGIAAVLVATLLRGFGPGAALVRTREDGLAARPLLLETAGLFVLPIGILASLFLFLRGHDLPGGGFIAGLVLAASIVVVHMGRGLDEAGRPASPDWLAWTGAGLLVSALTGLGSLAVGHPFLTSTKLAVELPAIGKVPLPTATFFDLGVYVAVTGATLLALGSLAHVRARQEGA